ncbi:MAG TPA: hypothetical protein VMS18_15160 [Candidatus Binatia bacterium]|nr:hypothetical protein [Candidatus Binatia bacterium]
MNCTKARAGLGIVYGALDACDGEQLRTHSGDFQASSDPPTTKSALSVGFSPNKSEAEAIALCRNLRHVLGELHALLEEYSPSWYTQQHNEHAETALHRLNGL